MANSLCFTPLASFNSVNKPGLINGNCTGRKIQWIKDVTYSSKSSLRVLEVKSLRTKGSFGVAAKLVGIYQEVTSSNCGNNLMQKCRATDNDQDAKAKSIICKNCDGNGAVLCSQCKGIGVNSEDYFSGRFKAGELCWLCGGKRDMLCGDCNGAGFLGGFMSTFDE